MNVKSLIEYLQTLNPDAHVKWLHVKPASFGKWEYEFLPLTTENIHEGKEGEEYEDGELIEVGNGDDFIVLGCPVI